MHAYRLIQRSHNALLCVTTSLLLCSDYVTSRRVRMVIADLPLTVSHIGYIVAANSANLKGVAYDSVTSEGASTRRVPQKRREVLLSA